MLAFRSFTPPEMKSYRLLAASSCGALPLALLALLAPGQLQAGSEPQFQILAGQGAGGNSVVQRLGHSPTAYPGYPRSRMTDVPGPTHPLPGSAIAIDEPGVHLAIADLDKDGYAELVTCTLARAGAGGGPHVQVFSFGSGGGSGVPPELTDPQTDFPIPGAASVHHYVAVGTFQDGNSRIIVAAGAGGGPHVKVFTPAGAEDGTFQPYGPNFNEGIRVAAGDVNGDGVAEIITAAGAGGGPHVRVFDGITRAQIFEIDPYDAGYAGGIHVAAGDVNGDGRADIITATGAGGGPHVKVFSGADFRPGGKPPAGVSYFPFSGAAFLGGVRVATGDVDGDGRADIFVAGVVNGRRRVEVLKSNKNGDPDANREMWTWTDEAAAEGDQFPIAAGDFDKDGLVELATGGVAPRALIWSPRSNLNLDFSPFPASTAGIRVASGDVNGDGVQDVILSRGAGVGPQVRAYDGRTGAQLRSFFAYTSTFLGGVYVAAGDVNGDGAADIVTGAGAGSAPHVKVFDGRTGAEIRSFFAYDAGFSGGVTVAAGDVNGDGFADIVTGAGAGGGPHVKVFSGATGLELYSFYAFDITYTGGIYVAAAPDGKSFAASRMGAAAGGGPHVKVFDGNTGAEIGSFSPFGAGFAGGVTVATGDVDGDGISELLAGATLAEEGPTVVGLDLGTQAQKLRCHLFKGITPLSPEAPFFAIGARPQPLLAMLPPKISAQAFQVNATGTPGTWLDFEISDDMLNWLPVSSNYIPDGDHILIGTTTPVVQGTRHYVRAVAK